MEWLVQYGFSHYCLRIICLIYSCLLLSFVLTLPCEFFSKEFYGDSICFVIDLYFQYLLQMCSAQKHLGPWFSSSFL